MSPEIRNEGSCWFMLQGHPLISKPCLYGLPKFPSGRIASNCSNNDMLKAGNLSNMSSTIDSDDDLQDGNWYYLAVDKLKVSYIKVHRWYLGWLSIPWLPVLPLLLSQFFLVTHPFHSTKKEIHFDSLQYNLVQGRQGREIRTHFWSLVLVWIALVFHCSTYCCTASIN